MKPLKTVAIAMMVFTGLLMATTARATITSYSSAATFDAAMTANSGVSGTTTTAFNGISSGSLVNFVGGTIGFSSGSSTGNNSYQFDCGSCGSYQAQTAVASPYTGYFLMSFGSTSETFHFTSPVYGFSFDGGLVWDYSTRGQSAGSLTFTIGGSSDTVNFSNVMTYFEGSYYAKTGQPIEYMGFSSDTPFTSATITDPVAGFSAQNITVATAIAVSNSTTTIPEPPSFPLLIVGGGWGTI